MTAFYPDIFDHDSALRAADRLQPETDGPILAPGWPTRLILSAVAGAHACNTRAPVSRELFDKAIAAVSR